MSNIAIYVREDKLGDALLKYPALRAFKQTLPTKSKIIWIIGNESSVFRESLSFLSKDIIFFFYEKIDSKPIVQLKDILDKHKVKYLINTESKIRPCVFLKRAHKGLYICSALNYLFSDRKPKGQDCNNSVFNYFCNLLTLASDSKLNLDFDIDVPKNYKKYANDVLSETRYVGFSPGASDFNKAWKTDYFIKLALLKNKYRFLPVFFLGPNETHFKEKILKEIPDCKIIPGHNLPKDINNIPLLTIATARKLMFSVANDSGGGHLLATGRKPMITIFGKNRAGKFLSPYCKQTSVNTQDFGKKNVVDLEYKPVYDEFIKMVTNINPIYEKNN
ncbi:MAG: glycosyltransferase family 9 protein [Pseudomonadota bacterium]|nr:glycosyltransferase family 9 protein [Pseudomonadota bacterium]